jgi:hypothetical protein
MDWLTEDARLVCEHESGFVQMIATQSLVTIDGRRVLVERDPEGREINGCPWIGPGGQKPCKKTLPVNEGYSSLLRIDDRRVCLDTVRGITDAIPAATFDYFVRNAGQKLVGELP